MLSILAIVMVEDPELSAEITRQGGTALYFHMFIALLAVCFLQNQLYNYLIPKSLRAQSQNHEQIHYSKSFFKGTIGLGYFLVVIHLIGPFILSANTNQPEGFMYIGTSLIFLGTLSKIKGIIANELHNINEENS